MGKRETQDLCRDGGETILESGLHILEIFVYQENHLKKLKIAMLIIEKLSKKRRKVQAGKWKIQILSRNNILVYVIPKFFVNVNKRT